MKSRLLAMVLLAALLVGVFAPVGVRAAAPELTLGSPSVSFEDEIIINIYFALQSTQTYPLHRYGMVVFHENRPEGTHADADAVTQGATYDQALRMYCVRTPGIPAKELGDEVWFKVYLRLDDGTYVYSRIAHYSPKKYAYNMLRSQNSSMDMKTLSVAMLKYGAAAQRHFGYKTDTPVDADLTPKESSLTMRYHEEMVPALKKPNHGQQGAFAANGGFERTGCSVTMGSAFAINFYLEPAAVPDGQVRLYCWSPATLERDGLLTKDNAAGSMVMKKQNGRYYGRLSGIAARSMGDGCYVAAMYEADGQKQTSGVITYSVSTYCRTKAAGESTMADLAAAMAVYGHYASLRGEADPLLHYAEGIAKVQTDTTLTLNFMADMHYCDTNDNAAEIRDTLRKMSMLSRYTKVDALVNLGDLVSGNEEKTHTLQDMQTVVDLMSENADCPVFTLRGNHDDNSWYSYAPDGYPGKYMPEDMISHREWSELAFRPEENGVVTDPAKPWGGYGYYDHEASKIRIFLLNPQDIPEAKKYTGAYGYDAYRCFYTFSSEQLNFVANALQFADKENPGEWAALFLTHIPLDTTNNAGYRFGGLDSLIRGRLQMLGIIDAYRRGSTYSFSGTVKNAGSSYELAEHFMVDVQADFTQKGPGDVIAFFSGHTHTDNVTQEAGYGDSLSRGYTYIGVWGVTSFSTCVIDREKNTVYGFKYGAVRTQSQSEGHNPGAIDGEAELGLDIGSGKWQVEYDLRRPTGENIWNGMSELWADGYIHTPTTLNGKTLELNEATPNSKYALSKAVMVKQCTTYRISDDFKGTVFFYSAGGTFNGTKAPVQTDRGKLFTIGDNGGYVVFCFHKSSYPGYRDFTLTEA